MKRTQLVIVLALVVLGAAGFGAWLFGGGGAGGLFATASDVVLPYEIKPNDRVHGDPNAPITIIEYASLTCSACAAFQIDVIPELQRNYIDTGKVKLVFRDHPLDAIARAAAACAHCMEGEAYFAFVDLLFRRQSEWIQDFDQNQQFTREDVEEGLARMGRLAGMTRERVMQCMGDPANIARVDASFTESWDRYFVNSTPTLIINGRVYAGMRYEALKEILDRT